MAQLVLTLVGDDRAGLVAEVARVVADHDGNWERSELAELAGAFAGIVLVTVPDARTADFTTALDALDGLLRVAIHNAGAPAADRGRTLSVSVLGNDRPGIVREITSTVSAQGLSIDSLTSRTLEAPMAGGTLFEAIIGIRVDSGADEDRLVEAIERLADEIQVDLSVSTPA